MTISSLATAIRSGFVNCRNSLSSILSEADLCLANQISKVNHTFGLVKPRNLEYLERGCKALAGVGLALLYPRSIIPLLAGTALCMFQVKGIYSSLQYMKPWQRQGHLPPLYRAPLTILSDLEGLTVYGISQQRKDFLYKLHVIENDPRHIEPARLQAARDLVLFPHPTKNSLSLYTKMLITKIFNQGITPEIEFEVHQLRLSQKNNPDADVVLKPLLNLIRLGNQPLQTIKGDAPLPDLDNENVYLYTYQLKMKVEEISRNREMAQVDSVELNHLNRIKDQLKNYLRITFQNDELLGLPYDVFFSQHFISFDQEIKTRAEDQA